NRTVNANQTVLVQLDGDRYGLYRSKVNRGLINIVNQDYADTTKWQRLTSLKGQQSIDFSTDDAGAADLVAGKYALDKHVIQSITLQLWDDVDVEASESLVLEAHDGIAVQSTQDLKLHHVHAGGDTRLQTTGDIIDLGSTAGDPTAAIRVFGDLVLNVGGSVSNGAD